MTISLDKRNIVAVDSNQNQSGINREQQLKSSLLIWIVEQGCHYCQNRESSKSR